jgi:hypothetical protein
VEVSTSGKFYFDVATNIIKLTQLRAGFRYTITFPTGSLEGLDRNLALAAVTSCTCNDALVDNTGRPQNFRIIQDLGHVVFNFTDNSHCEDAFSFSRVSKVEEFLLDFAENAVSFVSDFYYSSSEACYSSINPGKQASDDLSLR